MIISVQRFLKTVGWANLFETWQEGYLDKNLMFLSDFGFVPSA